MLISGWDFPVAMTGTMDRGHRVDLTLHLPGLLDSKETNRLMLIVSSFFELAGLGAFCGNTMQPSESQMSAAWNGCPNMVPGVMHWRLNSLSIDFKAWSVLFNMFQATEIPFDLVEVKSSGPDHLGALSPETRCIRHDSVENSVWIQSDFRSIQLDLNVEVNNEIVESLADTLVSWALVCGLGGFPKSHAELPHLVYPKLPTCDSTRIRFTVEERDLHPSAYAALDNLVAFLRAKNLPITAYAINAIN